LPQAPARRRVIPAPFKRDSVALVGGVRRAWCEVDVSEVEVGDIVPDVGMVDEVLERAELGGDRPGVYRTLVGIAGRRREFSPGEAVKAFQRER
jgi:hypothetical protein